MLESVVTSVSGLGALLGLLSLLKVRRVLKEHAAPNYSTELEREADIDLPSVSICIPARNERRALVACLDAVLASTYERQEVIVLDDVSGDDTSALIKSYASEGVRFVKGAPLKQGWLGKNHALQGLLDEASGTYILYIDVDTRLKPHSVEHLVRYALSHRLDMLSVLPRREDGWRGSVIWSPLRYFWSVLFYSNKHAATSSSAWIIRRDVLKEQFGGFMETATLVQPEQRFADSLQAKNRYRYLIGTANFGVGYEKKWRSQLLTSVRTIVPSFQGSLLMALLGIVGLCVLILPSAIITYYLLGTHFSTTDIIIAGISMALWWATYATYAHFVWRRGWWAGTIVWPLLLIQQIALIFASIYAYSFNRLEWKGRPIRPQAEN
ncbi:hypothetical protein BGO18_02305 [Candidatus Saccharibacteria bacterium 47-87]|nr:glycosyltransferase family 2 protein [Candidatus Saccharibacteria bacterium]OJU96990.1 MAG: hypothetical protein BGO18_02305 [Candidatus Saccharibacteria bacterium 47-87]